MNDFLKAAKGEEESEDRYEKLKKEEAGTDSPDPVKQRYNELKEKAKNDYEEQLEKAEENEDSEDDPGFVTY